MDDYKQNIECVNCQLLSLRDKERLWPCCDKPMLNRKDGNLMAKVFHSYQDVTFWIGRGEFGQCLRCGHEGSYSDIWSGIKLGGEKFCPACGRRIFFPLEDKSIINCIDVTLKEEDSDG